MDKKNLVMLLLSISFSSQLADSIKMSV